MKNSKIYYYFVFLLFIYSCLDFNEITQKNYKNTESSTRRAQKTLPPWLPADSELGKLVLKDSTIDIFPTNDSNKDEPYLSFRYNHPFLEEYRKKLTQIMQTCFSIYTLGNTAYFYSALSEINFGNVIFLRKEDKEEFVKKIREFISYLFCPIETSSYLPKNEITKKDIQGYFNNEKFIVPKFLNQHTITKKMYEFVTNNAQITQLADSFINVRLIFGRLEELYAHFQKFDSELNELYIKPQIINSINSLKGSLTDLRNNLDLYKENKRECIEKVKQNAKTLIKQLSQYSNLINNTNTNVLLCPVNKNLSILERLVSTIINSTYPKGPGGVSIVD